MRAQTNKEKLVLGMDERFRPDEHTASEISNFRVEDEGLGFINDRGWESLIPYTIAGGLLGIPKDRIAAYASPHRFLAVWSRHQDAEQYYLYEQLGKLVYEYGNAGGTTEDYILLDKDRHVPKASEPGTQLAPFGRFAVVVNGYNAPLIFGGREQVRTFSWTNRPATPTIIGVAPSQILPATRNQGDYVAILFDKGGYLGLGTPDNGAHNRFGYKVAFVSDTGSESPASIPGFVSWDIDNAIYEYKFGVFIDDLPIGPPGTVARKLYRTLNLGTGDGSNEVYYELVTIEDNVTEQYVDIHPDSYLTTQASIQDSSPILHSYRYASEYNGHMWLADDTKLIYSKQGLPEQFPDFNYFNVGVREGGPITGLHKLGDSLLVFRGQAIDVVNVQQGTYTCNTLDSNIGTIATNTIASVPGVGVVFLTEDGFYAISGSQRGGGTFRVQKVSVGLEREMKRLSTSALARATADYSHREKEYWCHYPVDGQTENTRGAVLHTLTGKWSLRHSMPFTQIATDRNGWFILGTRSESTSPLSYTGWPGFGLQVWSARYAWGDTLTYDSNDEDNYYYTVAGRKRDDSVWASPWEQLNDDATKKRVLSVEVEILTFGDNPIECLYSTDGNWVFTSAGTKTPQVPEYDNSTSAETVYTSSTTRTNRAEWDSTNWEGGKRTRLVYDVKSALVSTFKFKLESSNLMHVLSYKLLFVPESQRTMRRQ